MITFRFLTLIICLTCAHVFPQDWVTNFEDAKKDALQQNKSIVLVFQGSDWCGPCIKLDKEVWSTQEFRRLSEDHFIMLKADFPRKKANKLPEFLALQNAQLAERYNKKGYFPFVVLLDESGAVRGEMSYEKLTPKAYFKKLIAFEN